MKKKVLTRLALFCCLIVGLSVFSATQVQAHRTWRKYTKLPNGTYTIYSGILMLIVPILATYCGYIAGSKKFEFVEKIEEFMYEKEE